MKFLLPKKKKKKKENNRRKPEREKSEAMLTIRRFHSSMASSLSLCLSAAHPRRFKRSNAVFTTPASTLLYPRTSYLSFCSNSQSSTDFTDPAVPQYSSKQVLTSHFNFLEKRLKEMNRAFSRLGKGWFKFEPNLSLDFSCTLFSLFMTTKPKRRRRRSQHKTDKPK